MALVLVGSGAALSSLAVQQHLRETGPLAEAARDGAVVEVIGLVRAEPAPVVEPWAAPSAAPQRYRTVLAVEAVVARGRPGGAAARVTVTGGPQWAAVRYGTAVSAVGRLGPARSGDPSAAELAALGPPRIEASAGAVDEAVHALRGGLLDVTDGLGPDARGLVPGAAIGDTTRLPPDLDQAMRDVGLTHLTAVSGQHFAILGVAVLAVGGALRAPRAARGAMVLAAIAGFVLLVHPEPSVVRSAVMGAVAVLGLVGGRPSRGAPALCCSVVLLLVVDPWLSRSIGFALSAVATAAIVLAGRPVAARLGSVLPRGAAQALAVPLVAQAACAPVIVLLAPGLGTYAVAANLVAAPAVVPLTLLGLGATLTAPWAPALAVGLAGAAGVAADWVAAVARFGAALPGARLPWPEGGRGAIALTALTLLVPVAVAGVRAARSARTHEPATDRVRGRLGRCPPSPR